ncbi:tau 95 subunit of transcription factor TFIIIC [Rhodotorula kratochvilovae]
MDELRLPTPPPLVLAPTYALPPQGSAPLLAAIEYPAPVRSLDAALGTMGGIARISAALDASANAPAKPIELDLDPSNRFFHSVPAHVASNRNIVCRVIKRRRKVPRRDHLGNIIEEGVYSIQPVGVEHKTVRFRGMADFQYTPERHAEEDPTLQLADALTNMDIAAIRSFEFPAPTEEFPSSAFLPPPAFSRHALPQVFDYKPAAGTVQQVLDTGAIRLISSTRHKSRLMQSILFVQSTVPSGPEDTLVKELGRKEPTEIEQRLLELLEKRPVWTRTALINQLTHEELKTTKADKSCWPMVAYTFADGPFRDLVIRFGYDPRKEPTARFYQHLSLRNAANVRTRAQPGARGAAQAHAASAKHAKAEDRAPTTSHLSHEFDGVTAHGKVANFQLMDLSDALLQRLVHATDGVLDHCSSDGNEGWYARDYLDQIRQVLRRKWLGALEGVEVSDEDCADILRWEMSRESRAGRGAGAGAGEAAAEGKADKKGKGKGKARARSGSAASETPSRAGSGSGSGVGEGDDQDAEEEEEEGGSEVASSGAESGTPAPGGSSAARKPRAPRRSKSAVAKAPWELPKRKRPKAKQAESEADLLARLSQQARRKSSRVVGDAGTPAPQGDA